LPGLTRAPALITIRPSSPDQVVQGRMAKERFNELDERKKRAILDAAAPEFADRGYNGASINQVIRDAGISKGTMYYYFNGKEDL